jgi:type VI secretion system secreted protein Hcp
MAFDAFIKIGDIKGESLDAKHKDEIEVLSFSWGVIQGSQQGGRATGRAAGRADVQDFTIVKRLDKASPLLFAAACHGDHFTEAIFTARKVGEVAVEFYKITMSDVLISSVRPGGSAGSETLPLEEVSLNFGALKIEFTPQDATGKPGTPVGALCNSHR